MQGERKPTSAVQYPNLIMRGVEFIPRDERPKLFPNIRGVYALLKKRGKNYHVVYIGRGNGRSGILSRLRKHALDWNEKQWSYFSFFEVWPNIPDHWIEEMEAFFLQFFRKDPALKRNKIKKYGKFRKVTFKLESLGHFKPIPWKESINPKKAKEAAR